MKPLLVLGGLGIALAISLLLPALSTHARERAAWVTERDRVGTPAYSARDSDLHHARSEAARVRIRGGAQVLGVGLLLLLAGWRRPRVESGVEAPAGTRARVSAVDGGLGWVAWLVAFCGDSLGLWDSAGQGAAAAIEAMAWPLLFLPHAALLHGRSLGLSTASCWFVASRPRALLAALGGPIALPIMLTTLPFLRKRPAFAAVHLGDGIKMNAHSK